MQLLFKRIFKNVKTLHLNQMQIEKSVLKLKLLKLMV
jgi:hypothetical protein